MYTCMYMCEYIGIFNLKLDEEKERKMKIKVGKEKWA